jgi:hypothetical protein
MKITRRQLRRIISEAIDINTLKLADLVRAVDYEGDGRGGGFKPIVGKQIGTVIEIDEDPDYPTQYTVLFPDGTTIMDDLGPPGEERFELINEGNSTDPRGLKALLASLNVKGRDFGPVANSLALAYYDSEGSPQDMKDEVEHHSGGLPTSTDGEWIDWPIETYQEIWNLYKKAERSYKSPQSRGPRF